MAGEAHEAVAHGFDLVPIVALLGAAVVAVPIFKRAGLGPVLGYLAAGLAIGPWGIGLFHDAQAILHVAELGVVLFLFVIGLEMQPSRLWGMRREIFGLGLAQVGVCMLLLWTVGLTLGYPLAPVADRRHRLRAHLDRDRHADARGPRHDVPAAGPPDHRHPALRGSRDRAAARARRLPRPRRRRGDARRPRVLDPDRPRLRSPALIAAGRWLLNPMFRILANAHARELLTAAALLVVLGAALAMQAGGLSMAMGAFLAGVMLSESDLPPPARGRRRAVPRHPARPVLHERRHGARPARRLGQHRPDRRLGDPADHPEDARHLRRRPHRHGAATPRRSSARC